MLTSLQPWPRVQFRPAHCRQTLSDVGLFVLLALSGLSLLDDGSAEMSSITHKTPTKSYGPDGNEFALIPGKDIFHGIYQLPDCRTTGGGHRLDGGPFICPAQ
jgi:hypothetical protein